MKPSGLVMVLVMAVPCAVKAELQETPVFQQDVASGKLSRVDERLPKDPEVAVSETTGNPGGELRMLWIRRRDIRAPHAKWLKDVLLDIGGIGLA